MRKIRGIAVTLACLGLMFPQGKILAATPKAAEKPVAKAPVKGPIDVALAKGGTFQGRMVNDKGDNVEGAAVVIRQAGRVVAETTTDEEGRFSVKSLRGGTYEVKAGKVDGVCRLWSHDTAPPSAAGEITIVSHTKVVRGQDEGYFYPGTVDPWLATAIGLGTASLIVGLIAIKKANDAKDAANASP